MKNRLFRAFKILVYGAVSFLPLIVFKEAGEMLITGDDLSYSILLILSSFVFLILFTNACFDEIQNFNKPKDAPAKNVIFFAVFGPTIKYLSRKNFKPKKGTPEQEAKSARNLKVLAWIFIIIFFVAYGLTAYRNILE